MKNLNLSVAAILVVAGLASAKVAGAQYGIIYDFEPTNGEPVHPTDTLRTNSKGRLFGAFTDGTAFELKMREHGGWTERVTPNGPGGSNWIADGKGNYYTAEIGGTSNPNGTIVESSRAGDDHRTEKVIYSFGANATDGVRPSGSLVFDVQGNLYGTTQGGGTHSAGTAFELTKGADNKWTEKILYNFGASSTDAATPQGLTIDASGNLYGTTASGGPLYYQEFFNNYIQGGTVFELTRQSNGTWKESILHDFVPSPVGEIGYQSPSGDGWQPQPGLILDNKGNLYGTTVLGVTSDGFSPSDTIMEGTVFELSPATAGNWTERVLFLSCDNQVDCFPETPLVMDPAGNLYSTTGSGGSNLGVDDGSGSTIFEVTPQWEQVVLHNFPSTTTDGHPFGGVALFEGNLFGTTYEGGPDHDGTAYEIQGVASQTPIETKTTWVASPSSNLSEGEPITLTATVTAATGLSIPVGTVTFEDSLGRSIPEIRATVLVVAGKAVYTGVVPPDRNYSVKARYNGGFGFAPSESATRTGTVNK